MVRAFIDFTSKKIMGFFKKSGKREEAPIEISGLEDESIDSFHREQITRIAKEHLERIGAIVPVHYFKIQIKPRRKGAHLEYSFRAHAETELGQIASKDRSMDLISLSNEVLSNIERQVKTKVGKNWKKEKEFGR